MATARQKSDWERSSLLCAILANCHRDPKLKPFTPDDFNKFAIKKQEVINDKKMFMQALKDAFIKKGIDK